MFRKGGMDMNFHYLNFIFVLIIGTILIYDFFKIKSFKKIVFVFVGSLFTFISGIYLVEGIIEKIYGSDYELHIRFNNLEFKTNILFYCVLVLIELLLFQIIKRFYK
jgi:hypothetical protein